MTAGVDIDELRARIGAIRDPELDATLSELGMLGDVTVTATTVRVGIALTTLGCPARARFRGEIGAIVDELAPGRSLIVDETELDHAGRARAMRAARAAAQRRAEVPAALLGTDVIAVASGKGGVGKSTVAHALARALTHGGNAVGLLDADIWGFSQPHLTERRERLVARGTSDRWEIEPARIEVDDGELRLVSMGLLVDDADDAIMWRGPMLARALEHFVADVAWGQPSTLVVDLPPGTGDVPLALARLLPDARVVVVTTPSPLAVEVAVRAGTFARKANLDVLGVIENLSWLRCEHGDLIRPFGEGGGTLLAQRLGVPLLATLPIGLVDDDVRVVAETITRELAARSDHCSARLWAYARLAQPQNDR
ncbi:protein of unknown function DUF59 [Acidimicrobium ferrooxidans DSM 10331]|uniref:Iron-sulfur cluster carrier protein n=1 Tax=Acidimicrobium ferrooxidans (strain DSM 10331 / JCM 15462 / NBRC 103882 / ICP) TaxID=525909 RepID=C7M2F9_ACIFD|nr:P-loop NTPase [Acidimicrobium ferrooxidans]ACU53203.1 protein of unknown function DUF59 [Acidimicrobium ferrooxidans DSM 10331]